MVRDGLTPQELKEVNKIARSWSTEKRKELINNISSLGLVKTGKLKGSIKSGIRMDMGEVRSIWFKYEWYGLFHDAGAQNAGKGNSIQIPAKHWMAKFIYGKQLDTLLEDLSDYYMNITIESIKLDDVKA